jgi:hypothetical protein
MNLYKHFWSFARARQHLFYTGKTLDPILQTYRFTNCYRVLDRVSQYLIKRVIAQQQVSQRDLLFRILLFKTFNKVSTWEWIDQHVEDEIRHYDGWVEDYEVILREHQGGMKLFAPAYRYASGYSSYGYFDKYRNYLRMIEDVVQHHEQLLTSSTYEELFLQLWRQPMIGPFFAMQFATDINYSELVDFDENDFVYPGPGCRRGVAKVWGCSFRDDESIMGRLSQTVDEQYKFNFPCLLWEQTDADDGSTRERQRALSLMDVQNLYCEFDKYLRLDKPELNSVGRGNRKPLSRPKQKYTPSPLGRMRWPEDYTLPKKWRER